MLADNLDNWKLYVSLSLRSPPNLVFYYRDLVFLITLELIYLYLPSNKRSFIFIANVYYFISILKKQQLSIILWQVLQWFWILLQSNLLHLSSDFMSCSYFDHIIYVCYRPMLISEKSIYLLFTLLPGVILSYFFREFSLLTSKNYSNRSFHSIN